MALWYGCALALSGFALFAMAVTRFGTTSVVDRLLCAAIAVPVLIYAYHLLFRYEGGQVLVFYAAFVLPFYVGFRLVRGFRRREADRAERAAAAASAATIEDWRSTRRW
ncbi:hypothetical protein [Catellatospora sp. NPDC049609]|uniref:hypothetical protein n=1 Tax=Catellatospora sp. NPDC049609 TaxID=3155505 RepID=UPI003415195D